MVVLDTHVLIHDALAPARLSRRAKRLLNTESLACSDISLWEIGMLVSKGRVTVETQVESFLEDIIRARNLRVLEISPRIAALAQSTEFSHADPADRIIAATAIAHRARLLSADARLKRLASIEVVW
ncbi:MAG: type II toxin-antitoxin system VapC family toxin [Betaproteobacteria bacterium]|nr:type II toxin-antitoxin system VapC family toxin [Betaproteobacteria bacterium]